MGAIVVKMMRSVAHAWRRRSSVEEVQLTKLKLITSKEQLSLYLDDLESYYYIVFQPTNGLQPLSLIRCETEAEARKRLNDCILKLQPLLQTAENDTLQPELRRMLQKLVDAQSSNPGWTCAHIAVRVQLYSSFDNQIVAQYLNTLDASAGVTPLMMAVDAEDSECVKKILTAAAAYGIILDCKDAEGCTVFHHVAMIKNERISQLFFAADRRYFGSSLDDENDFGETPLQVAVKDNKMVCAFGLLVAGADANRALRLAIEMDNTDLVKMALVMGADANHVYNNTRLLKIAEGSKQANRDAILKLLRRTGATDADRSAAATSNDSPVIEHSTAEPSSNDSASTAIGADCERVLCLDGGGIRGLVLIKMLMAIEKAVGRPIKECFDRISGTSTGGILALAILCGKSLRYCLGAYLRMKNEVFTELFPPYDPGQLEGFMREVYGETTTMKEVDSWPRVIVTTVLADRWPAELHLFRNYEGPDEVLGAKDADPALEWSKQLLWKVARSTSAAPFFFPKFDRFLDGGVIANNPTIDTLTEIQQLNEAYKAQDHQAKAIQCSVVVSLGCGLYKEKPLSGGNIFNWKNPGDLVRDTLGIVGILKVLADQVTQSNGRIVERAVSWCRDIDVPFYRLNPQLSEHISLDCTDDDKLINMLWETHCYIHDRRSDIAELSAKLRSSTHVTASSPAD